jgi:hypothetical protein
VEKGATRTAARKRKGTGRGGGGVDGGDEAWDFDLFFFEQRL